MTEPIISKIATLGEKLLDGLFGIFSKLIKDKDLESKLKTEVALKISDWQFQQTMKLLEIEKYSNSKFVTWWRPAVIWFCIIPSLTCYGLWNNIFYPIIMMVKNNEVVRLQLDAEFIILVGSITGLYIISRSVDKFSNPKEKE